MAGTYPDVPGYRFAYDKDGTMMYIVKRSGSAPILLEPSMHVSFNRNQATTVAFSDHTADWWYGSGFNQYYLTLFFPEQRSISGYCMIYNSNSGYDSNWRKIEGSNDANTPIDGTWTTLIDPYVFNQRNLLMPYYRTDIQIVNWSAYKAIRIYAYNSPMALHLYGSIAPTESPDRLRIVDMSGDDIAAQLDFGDIRQRNNVTKQFKVVNNSSTKTANNITVTFDTNPDASPTLIGQYQLSTDNTAFANAINIGNLNPGQSSPTLYLRDTIASNAQLGPWTIRLTASANTWS